jgi:hypothetical protein
MAVRSITIQTKNHLLGGHVDLDIEETDGLKDTLALGARDGVPGRRV